MLLSAPSSHAATSLGVTSGFYLNGVIVVNRGNDRLDEPESYANMQTGEMASFVTTSIHSLEEDEQILVHTSGFATISERVNNALHHSTVTTRMDGCMRSVGWQVWMRLNRDSLVCVVLHDVLQDVVG